MHKKITYTSVWNNGYEVTTEGKLNLNTNEVYDVERSNDIKDDEGNMLTNFVEEYIRIDGIRCEVENTGNTIHALMTLN